MKNERIHFCGVAGSGLSALARLARWRGMKVSGSDRDFDRGICARLRGSLQADGIIIVPQNGAGAAGAKMVVSSAAVEKGIPDLAEARRMGVPIVTRAAFLRELAGESRRIAVAGTNGKSSTTAMLAWILDRTGRDPSVVLGATIRGEWGGVENARAGGSDLFCFEADESDGELDLYTPEVGIITNISEDHFPREKLMKIFSAFAAGVTGTLVLGSDSLPARGLAGIAPDTITFSLEGDADLQARNLVLGPGVVRFRLAGMDCKVPVPGRHSAANALAALAAAAALGIETAEAAAALRDFPGVGRRLELIGRSGGIAVADDYAHNPAKIAAALEAARHRGERLIVVYRPHGFGPLRAFLPEYASAFRSNLRKPDRLILLPVYDAGGTADRSVGSKELAAAVGNGIAVDLVETAGQASSLAAAAADNRTTVLVMGARDPALPELAREILRSLENRGE